MHLKNAKKHDDVMKWKHFPRYWPLRSPVNSPHKGQWRGALVFSLICVWINGWVNNREATEAGDLRRHCTHYDVIIMKYLFIHACLMLLRSREAHMHQWNKPSLVQTVSPVWHQTVISTWSKTGLLLSETVKAKFSNVLIKIQHVHPRKWIWKCSQNGVYIVLVSMC